MEWKTFPYRHLLPYGVKICRETINGVDEISIEDTDKHVAIEFDYYDMTEYDVERMLRIMYR